MSFEQSLNENQIDSINEEWKGEITSAVSNYLMRNDLLIANKHYSLK